MAASGHKPLTQLGIADPQQYLERYRRKRYPRLARSEMNHATRGPHVQCATGLLRAAAPLFGIRGLTTRDLKSAVEQVVKEALPRGPTGVDVPVQFGATGLLASLGINALSVSQSTPPSLMANVRDTTAPGRGFSVTYQATGKGALATAIQVGNPAASADLVDPITWRYDASSRDYTFGFSRGGLLFICFLVSHGNRWASILEAEMPVGGRFPSSLIVEVPDSIHWTTRRGADIAACTDPDDDGMLIGVNNDSPLIIVERDAVYMTPAQAAAAILVGLPKTDAVRAAGDRDPDFRLRAGSR
jgi:hypothetical protein